MATSAASPTWAADAGSETGRTGSPSRRQPLPCRPRPWQALRVSTKRRTPGRKLKFGTAVLWARSPASRSASFRSGRWSSASTGGWPTVRRSHFSSMPASRARLPMLPGRSSSASMQPPPASRAPCGRPTSAAMGRSFIPLVVSIRHGHLYAMTENLADYRLTPVNRNVFAMPADCMPTSTSCFSLGLMARSGA